MSEQQHKHLEGSVPDSDLRRMLDRSEVPPARAEFKEHLRAMFLAGESMSAAADEAGTEPEPALAALLDQGLVLPSRPEFRASLRKRFVSVAGATPLTPLAVPRAAGTQRRHLRLLVGGVAAAAAVVAMLFVQGVFAPGTAKWHALAGDYAGLRIDGERVADLSAAELDHRLDHARRVSTAGGTLRMEYDDGRFVLELGADTVLGLDRMPAAVDAKDLVLVGDAGSFRVVTGPKFPGTELQFATSLFEARVTGTVFGIDVLEEGICLCVTEGTVDLVPIVGASPRLHAVGTGRRCSVDWQGGAVEGPVCPPHAVPLESLVRTWRN